MKFCVCCSMNCKASYEFGKRVAQCLKVVADLKRKGVFEQVADKVLGAPGDERPTEPTVGLESTFDKVWSSLTREVKGIVWLYGLGGVGKTTLLKEINNSLLSKSIPGPFEKVIWVVVSKDHKIDKIQDSIGEKIGLEGEMWRSKSLDVKAADIHRVLKGKRFALLLDDIWERVDLAEVGVPIQNGSKIVFTTRSKEVCGEMESHARIKVECLTWEKAWELFQNKVGHDTLKSHPEIPEIAKIVAQECGGLPLALITIGRAMSYKKTPDEWIYTIEILKECASRCSGMDKVLRLLKLSYDNLPSDAHRSCLLYFSLFPEDRRIRKGEVIDYLIGEGFLEEQYDPRYQGHHIIGTLVRACLLEESEGNVVHVHDVVRDMGSWIACDCEKENNYCLSKTNAGLTCAPPVPNGVRRMSLIENKIQELLETPLVCSHLITLLLKFNELRSISSGFFEFMPKLVVLDLSYNHDIRELPRGISKLVSLQYLNLSSTGIEELPEELKKLVKLKCLNLEHTLLLRVIPPKLISSFVQLRTLRMVYSGSNDESVLEELQSLQHLSTLTLDLKSEKSLKIVGNRKFRSCIEALSLKEMNSARTLSISPLSGMNRLELLLIHNCESVEELKVDMPHTGKYFDKRYHVCVDRCPRLRDFTSLILCTTLRSLFVLGCREMETIIISSREDVLKPTSKLETLRISGLPRLSRISTSTLPFPCLKEMSVLQCPELRQIMIGPYNSNKPQVEVRGEEEWWNNLEWEDEAMKNTFQFMEPSIQKGWTRNISLPL